MKIINKELQKLYTISGIFLSILCLFLTLFVSFWFNIGFLLVVAILTSSTGVEFDVDTKRYRKYAHFCFWTRGEWKNIGENKELVILVKRKTIGENIIERKNRIHDVIFISFGKEVPLFVAY